MTAFSGRCITLLGLVCAGLPALGCGGGDNGGTPPSTTAIAKASTSGDAQTAQVGQALATPLQVVVTDGGAPAAGATVTWSTTTATGSLSPTSTATDANGTASTTWLLGTVAGQQSAQATLSGASGSPITFTATATAGLPTTLAQAGGNNQTGQINTALAIPVQAKVTDEFGNGVAGVDVAWAATGATVAPPTVPSNGSGISAATVTLGGTAGPITITATSNDLSGAALNGSPVTFSATATEQPPPSTDANVNVSDNQFSPASLTISAGTTVVWTWGPSAHNHNVAPAASEPARSGNPVNGPHTYQYKFNTPGTYVYFCEVHGTPTTGMKGTIIVQ
jgi:plastocyanin